MTDNYVKNLDIDRQLCRFAHVCPCKIPI